MVLHNDGCTRVRRRDFLAFVGAAIIITPKRAAAQSAAKAHRVGLLGAVAPMADDSPFPAPFIHGLAKHGYTQGRNVVFVRRGAEGHFERLPGLVQEPS